MINNWGKGQKKKGDFQKGKFSHFFIIGNFFKKSKSFKKKSAKERIFLWRKPHKERVKRIY
jgi:hypothetical protein